MKKFFKKYLHWIALFFLGLNVMQIFINFNSTLSDIVAIIMGVIGLLSLGYLTFVFECKIRKKKLEK